MRRDIENYIRKCESCQSNKHTVKNTKMEMEVTDTPYATFEKISLDCMGPLPLTEQGNKFILTCQCNASAAKTRLVTNAAVTSCAMAVAHCQC
jgi:hypothetical protein